MLHRLTKKTDTFQMNTCFNKTKNCQEFDSVLKHLIIAFDRVLDDFVTLAYLY